MKNTYPDRFLSPLQTIMKPARLERNMTQARLGERCGCSQVMISRIELEQCPPPLLILRRICFVLDLEYAELFAVCFPGETVREPLRQGRVARSRARRSEPFTGYRR
jgi:transcriptional regulator with XRE-family HTH domain